MDDANSPAAPERVLYAHLPEKPGRDKDLPDPWYGDYGDFVDTLAVIERSTPALVDYVRP